MFTPFDDLTDGDLIRRIAALRRLRTGRPMGYPRYSGEITLMLAELLARGVELDENGNRLFIVAEPRLSTIARATNAVVVRLRPSNPRAAKNRRASDGVKD